MLRGIRFSKTVTDQSWNRKSLDINQHLKKQDQGLKINKMEMDAKLNTLLDFVPVLQITHKKQLDFVN